MENTAISNELLSTWGLFILMFARVSGLFIIAPLFGRRNVPMKMKAALSFFIALISFSTYSGPEFVTGSWIALVAGAASEFLLGLFLGYLGFVIFSAIYLGGQMIDMQIGFGVVNVMDPSSQISIPVTANMYQIISMLFFICFGGHQMLIRAIHQSFTMMPVPAVLNPTALTGMMVELFSSMWLIAIQMSMPIVFSALMTDISLGMITKTVPSLNIFVVGMPMKIILGLALLIITMGTFVEVVERLMLMLDKEMYETLTLLGG